MMDRWRERRIGGRGREGGEKRRKNEEQMKNIGTDYDCETEGEEGAGLFKE